MAVIGPGRASAGVVGGALAGVAVAIAVIEAYPDPLGLQRLYAGVFIGTAAWVAMIFVALLSPGGARAWRRVLVLLAAATTTAALHRGLLA